MDTLVFGLFGWLIILFVLVCVIKVVVGLVKAPVTPKGTPAWVKIVLAVLLLIVAFFMFGVPVLVNSGIVAK
jgi:hypothetical protein